MIKAAAFLVAALIVAPVFASTGAVSDATLSTGGPSDSRLAAAALARGDFAHAARKLKLVRAEDASDPARLINLGNAYLGMGRMREARAAYSAARTATDDMLVLADGTEESSRNIAGRALRRLNASYASR